MERSQTIHVYSFQAQRAIKPLGTLLTGSRWSRLAGRGREEGQSRMDCLENTPTETNFPDVDSQQRLTVRRLLRTLGTISRLDSRTTAERHTDFHVAFRDGTAASVLIDLSPVLRHI